jgi:hypothetical protein
MANFSLKTKQGNWAKQGGATDGIDLQFNGLCTECMVLRADANVVDKDFKRLGVKDGIYVHHFIVNDLGRAIVMPPALPFGKFCPGNNPFAGNAPRSGGIAASGKAHSHALTRRYPQGFGLGSILRASVFIGKGNDADPLYFAAPNSTIKSGFWLSKADKIVGGADIVHYKDIDQEVYLGIDMEYIQFDKKPADYLDVGSGAVGVDCAFILRKYSCLAALFIGSIAKNGDYRPT